MTVVIGPVPDRDDEFFWDGVAHEQLLVRRCARCGRLQHPPSPMCPQCGSLDWKTEQSSGRGVVLCWIVTPSDLAESRLIALIELEEGIRLVSNLIDVHPPIPNELAVEVTFLDVGGVTLPQFRPRGA